MEFFFQYIHAFFTSPRRDSTVAELVTGEYLEQIKMLSANPMYKFILGFMDMTTQNDPYQKQLMSEEDLKTVDYNRAFQLYQQRFANPADFIFTFVGNFDENLIKEYIELYLGSLQTSSERETPKYDVVKGFPENQMIENIYAGEEEQSWVGIAYEHDMEWTPKNTMIVQEINEALQIELIATIREKMSGVYSPMLQMAAEKEPKPSYSMMIMFSCSPDNTDKLAEACFNILKDFTEKGPSAETLSKVKNQMINDHQTSLKKNNMWLSYISSKYQTGEDINSINTYEERVNAITTEDIVKFMKENFDINQYVKAYLYPEKMKK
jgi:zinc protease